MFGRKDKDGIITRAGEVLIPNGNGSHRVIRIPGDASALTSPPDGKIEGTIVDETPR